MSTSFIRGLRRGDVEVDFVTIEAKASSQSGEAASEEEEEAAPKEGGDAQSKDAPSADGKSESK
jgi:hypothetical protein